MAAAFPSPAVDFIERNHLTGNVLVPFNSGGYAIWRLYPACRVSMDGRETVHQDSTHGGVGPFFTGAAGWSQFLNQFPHGIILALSLKRLEANMKSRSDWIVAYEDERNRVYVRASQSREWASPPRCSTSQRLWSGASCRSTRSPPKGLNPAA